VSVFIRQSKKQQHGQSNTRAKSNSKQYKGKGKEQFKANQGQGQRAIQSNTRQYKAIQEG